MGGGRKQKRIGKAKGSTDGEAVPVEPIRLVWVSGGSSGQWFPDFRVAPSNS